MTVKANVISKMILLVKSQNRMTIGKKVSILVNLEVQKNTSLIEFKVHINLQNDKADVFYTSC